MKHRRSNPNPPASRDRKILREAARGRRVDETRQAEVKRGEAAEEEEGGNDGR